jgi:peptidoglycan-associated lipoprotein
MKRSLAILGIIGLIVCLSFMVMTGCAKKSAVKDQAVSAEEKAASDRAAEQADAKARADQEARLAAEQRAKEEAEAKVAPQAEAAAVKEEMTFKDVLFEYDKFSLKPESRDILKQLAEWLTNNRGTTEYNLALGERRAKEAMKYLVELGIDGKRIKTISYGKERPFDPGNTEEAWAKNRRDHFVVTSTK